MDVGQQNEIRNYPLNLDGSPEICNNGCQPRSFVLSDLYDLKKGRIQRFTCKICKKKSAHHRYKDFSHFILENPSSGFSIIKGQEQLEIPGTGPKNNTRQAWVYHHWSPLLCLSVPC